MDYIVKYTEVYVSLIFWIIVTQRKVRIWKYNLVLFLQFLKCGRQSKSGDIMRFSVTKENK